MATSRPYSHFLNTIFPLILISVILGDIALFTISFTILSQLIIKAVQTLDNLVKAWHDRKKEKLTRTIAIVIARVHAQYSKHIDALCREQAAEKRKRVEAETRILTVRNQLEAEHAKEIALLRKELKEAVKGRDAAENRALSLNGQAQDEHARELGLLNAALSTTFFVTLPEDLLNLDPLNPCFTCIGLTKRNGRCGQSMLSNSDKRNAAIMLNSMRSANPEASLFKRKSLCVLATLLLCPRWHREGFHSQVDCIASRWFEQLRPEREALESHNAALKPRRRAITRSTPSSSSTSSSSTSSTSSSSLSSSSTSSISPTRSSASSSSLTSYNTSTSKTPLSSREGSPIRRVAPAREDEHTYTGPNARKNLTPAFQAIARSG